jgi:hypothetical protein
MSLLPHSPGAGLWGVDVRRLCDLIDPQSHSYNAAYTDVLWKEANCLASSPTEVSDSQLTSPATQPSISPSLDSHGGGTPYHFGQVVRVDSIYQMSLFC